MFPFDGKQGFFYGSILAPKLGAKQILIEKQDQKWTNRILKRKNRIQNFLFAEDNSVDNLIQEWTFDKFSH